MKLTSALLCAATIAAPIAAQAQDATIRIAQQFGLSYLPLRIAIDRQLIEKHAKALGVDNVKVEVATIASGAAVNDALISGSVDVAMAGSTVLLNLWDKTRGRDTIKGMMAIADTPIYFNSIDPRVKSIKDLTPDDRIAMTAGKGTQHALVLQMAAAQAFGWDERKKLDDLAVSMSHPDGVAALLSGGAVVKTHATTVPFIQMELADPRVHTILNSFDVVGGRHTLIVAYTRESWFTKQPKLYEATYKGLSEAIDIINADKAAAAEFFVRDAKSSLSKEEVLKLLNNPDMITFTATPSLVMPFADYMVKIGMLRNKPAGWTDVFFSNVHHLQGS
ncbi:ABC transporter substrate-binding protein [Xanthobacter pseudotagetidis]|uniref:ABC transporter substrate-binding protein n=1 Tax=Xanthobacter pseudotagetidis TaxID=3119911 RepID=UPI003729A2C3